MAGLDHASSKHGGNLFLDFLLLKMGITIWANIDRRGVGKKMDLGVKKLESVLVEPTK